MSTASTTVEPTGPPSLGNLPPELKLRIVEMVDQVDEQDEIDESMFEDLEEEEVDDEGEHVHGENCSHDHGHGHSHAHEHSHGHGEVAKGEEEEEHQHAPGGGCCGAPVEPSSMSNLCRVNAEFAGLAQPFLWKHVEFTDRSTESVYTFISEILPRHARHVLGVTFSQNDIDPEELSEDEQDSALPTEDLVKKAEEYSGVAAGDLSLEIRQSRARGLFFSTMLGHLPNLDTLDFDFHYLKSFKSAEPLGTDYVMEAAKKVGSKIEDLTLSNEEVSMYTEGEVATFLTYFPNVLRLDMGLILHPTGRDELLQSLVGYEKLETLSLVSAPYVNEQFASAAWKAPLKILALEGCEELSFPSFRTLVHKFSPTLEVLDIDDVPHTNSEVDNTKWLGKPIDLPKLNTLVLTTLHEAKFLDSFATLPIEEFELGFCPSIPYEALEAFIRSHEATLKQFTIHAGSNLTEAQMESIEVLCHAKGVNCDIELDEEEDYSDEDGEGEEWESDDEDGEALYEESDDE